MSRDSAERMNSLSKNLVSATMDKAAWNNSTIIKENVAEQISALTQQSGQDILLFSSGTLVQTLMQQDLVDRYHLLVYPVILGKGKRLFQDGSQANLRLIDTKVFSSGVAALIYQPD